MSLVKNQDIRIFYEVVGQGQPLVLLHGFAGNSKDWKRNGYVEKLSDDYQLILIDERGHGLSDKPHDPAAYEIEKRASDPQLARMNSCLVDDQGSENPFSLTEYEDRFREWLNTNIWTVDVFLHDGQIIGYSVYQERTDYYDPNETVIYIRQYYIKRSHRRLGLGKAAFQILIDTRFPKGVQSIALHVMATNSVGQNFWRKMGFNEYFILIKKELKQE